MGSDAPPASAEPGGADPFRHHPELRGRIAEAEGSFFRTFSAELILRQHPELVAIRDWIFPDAVREAIRAQALAGHSGDLWVFAYGSLMWDPALRFAEVRRARADSHVRRLILMDDKGGRGTAEAPGLMAALDVGDGCEGLAFRIEAAEVGTETEILFRRETIGPGYLPAFIPVRIDGTTVSALTFLADHAVAEVLGAISRADQVRYIATGRGFLGTSRAYLASIVEHFAHLGIEDADCSALLREVDAYQAARDGGAG